MNYEGFVRLQRRIAIYEHGNLLGCLIGGEGDCPVVRLVVVVHDGGCAVNRLEIHRSAQLGVPSLGYRKDKRGRAAAAFVVRHINYLIAWLRVVVNNRSVSV